MMPLNIGALEGMKAFGIDLMGQHRDDFPPEYLSRIELGQTLLAMDIVSDQTIRSEVYDSIQNVLTTHDLLVSPTVATMPVDNAADGNTIGPTKVNGVDVDPLIGWCLTYLTNFSGHPSASIPAGLSNGLPVGMQLIGRRYADGDVLSAAACFERLRPWKGAYRICRAHVMAPHNGAASLAAAAVIKLGGALYARLGSEHLVAQIADLVLALTLLPTGNGSAGHRSIRWCEHILQRAAIVQARPGTKIASNAVFMLS